MTERYSLGIEFGSTRIKAVIINESMDVIAVGSHTWENHLVDGIWSYALEDAWAGVQKAYARLAEEYKKATGTALTSVSTIGISAMMHGYLAFNETGELLVPFRTWRNTITHHASEELTKELGFTIPQRWSIAHLYQAVLNGEPHVSQISFLTTLSGYVHWKLTGEKILGVGDASGVFPIDAAHGWDGPRLGKTQAKLDAAGAGITLAGILPEVRDAGADAGILTAEGALLLDPAGVLQAGIPLCPPEGDAGTGMVATNAVAPRTGNISAGTSIFAMIVLERELADLHPEIDMVTTPAGDPVAMVHCNNGASEIDAWAQIFSQFAAKAGCELDTNQVFATLFGAALDGDKDGGGILAYNYLAGEPITGLEEGRPLILRTPDSKLNLANFMRTLIMSSFGTLSLGMRILESENVEVDSMFAHGGIFATKGVAQSLMAAALSTPVSVGETAAEGGAWGMAVLASYALDSRELSLADFLVSVVFADAQIETIAPDPDDVEGYTRFLEAYEKAIPVLRTAVETS
ncbi:MAG: ATPase [Propionibacteriaceae bacterium]|jgi:sugar (pentulose or hexulose) kinase|nr:ATPase [Propionibacteriaceae bacterium]